MATVSEELHKLIDRLSSNRQRQLLELAKMLMLSQADPYLTSFPESNLPPSKPGSALEHFDIPLEDVRAMEKALEDCERIFPDEYRIDLD